MSETKDGGAADATGFANLACDAEGCGYELHVGQVTEDLIDMPCPKCGANLLTRADYEASKPMFYMLLMMERLGIAKPVMPDDAAGESVLSVHHHDGETTIKIAAREARP